MAKKTRKTRDGRYVLRDGEYERSGDRTGYYYKWRDAYGTQCSISAPTLQELREKEKDVKIGQLEGRVASKQRKTVNDYYNVWLQQRQRAAIKPNTLSNQKYMYEKYVSNSMIGRKQISQLKTSDIIKYYGDLVEKTGLAVSTVDSIHTVLHQVIDIAVRDDIIRRNPSEGCLKDIKGKAPKKQPKALTPEEQQAFLDAIRGTQWECIFGIALLTGLRVAELSALCWSDIDYDACVIHVQRNFVYYRDQVTKKHKGDLLMDRRIQSTKSTAGDRFIALNAEIIRLLDLYKEVGNVNDDVVDSDDGTVSGFIFGTRATGGSISRCYNQGSLNKALKRIVRDNNAKPGAVLLPDIHMHMLRKTYCSNLCRASVPLVVASKLMGHSDISVTSSIYTDVQKDMLQSADAQLQAYLDGERRRLKGEQKEKKSAESDGAGE